MENETDLEPAMPFSDFLREPLMQLEKLEENDKFSISMRDQVIAFKVEVQFLRSSLLCIAKDLNQVGSPDLKSKAASAEVVVQRSVHRMLWSISNDTNPESQLSIDLKQLKMFGPLGQASYYRWIQLRETHQLVTPTSDELMMEFLNSVLKNLKHLVSYGNDLVVPVKEQFEVLSEKLIWLRDVLGFATKRCIRHDKMKNLLVLIDYVATYAASISHRCWVEIEKVDQGKESPLLSLLSALVLKIKPVELSTIDIYIGVLRGSSYLLHSDAPNEDDELARSFVHLLMEDPIRLAKKMPSGSTSDRRDQIETIREALIGMVTYLVDPPEKVIGSDGQPLDDILLMIIERTITAVGGLAASLQCSQGEETGQKLDFGLSQFSQAINHMHEMGFRPDSIVQEHRTRVRESVAKVSFCEDPMNCLEWQELKGLINEKELLQILKDDVKFVTRRLSFSSMWQNNDENLEERAEDLVRRVGADLHLHCYKGYYEVHDVLSGILEQIKPIKAEITTFHISLLKHPPQSYNASSKELEGFLEILLENLQLLLKTGANLSVDRLKTLENKLMHLKHLLGFISGTWIRHEKIRPLLCHIGDVAQNAASVLYSCFNQQEAGDKTASSELNGSLSDLLHNTKPIEQAVVYVDSIVYDLVELQKQNADRLKDLEEPMEIIQNDLRFLRSFLMDPLKQHSEDNNENHQLLFTKIEDMTSILASSFSPFVEDDLQSMGVDLEPVLFDLLERLELIKADMNIFYLGVPKISRSSFPTTHQTGFINSFVSNLSSLKSKPNINIALVKQQQLAGVTECFEYFISCRISEKRHDNDHLGLLWTLVIQAAYELEYVMDNLEAGRDPSWYYIFWFSDIAEEITRIRTEITNALLPESNAT